MTAFQFAFVLLCLAQIIHFSRHWYLLTADLWDDAQEVRRRNVVDWKASKRSR